MAEEKNNAVYQRPINKADALVHLILYHTVINRGLRPNKALESDRAYVALSVGWFSYDIPVSYENCSPYVARRLSWAVGQPRDHRVRRRA